jgi:hypothetical protein
VVTTFAGSGTLDFADGNGSNAGIGYPLGIDVDSSGNLFFVANFRIRMVTPVGGTQTSNLAGVGGCE